ncbi:MAG: hypothetical protein J5794_08920, partial [Lachnospiraceae bacterium]|nr:hypothetical protein [Lachnospiraceae bacterium]
MEEVIQRIRQRISEDQTLLRNLEKLLTGCPEGRIQVTTASGHPKYYWIHEGQRTYLGKEERDQARRLMEKSYYRDLLRETREELKALRQFLTCFDPSSQIRVYESMHDERRKLVDPLVLPDDLFVRKWLEESQRQLETHSNNYAKPEGFLTLNGETVRSKSEKILADTFHHHSIPYVYECPLLLNDGVVFPDFKLLNVRTRKTYYWEHCGMMDNPEYLGTMIQKIQRYARSGIYQGDQLIVSMETSCVAIDMTFTER